MSFWSKKCYSAMFWQPFYSAVGTCPANVEVGVCHYAETSSKEQAEDISFTLLTFKQQIVLCL